MEVNGMTSHKNEFCNIILNKENLINSFNKVKIIFKTV